MSIQEQSDGRSRPAVSIIGAGRAGAAIAVALSAAGYRIAAVHSRTQAHAAGLAARVGAIPVAVPLQAVQAAGLTFLTVPDAAITPVAAGLAASGVALAGRGVVHCCASLGRDAIVALHLTGASVGAVHPLQALSGGESAALLRGSLFAVDVDEALRERVTTLVNDLGGTAVEIPPEQRALYHAAAVLTAGGAVALLTEAVAALSGAMDAETATRGLAHLLAGAAVTAGRRGDPRSALTGPVVRGDAATVARHLDALQRSSVRALDLYVDTARAVVAALGAAGREDVVAALDAVAPPRGAASRRGRAA